MSLTHWLSNRHKTRRPITTARKASPGYRPRLEALEVRCLLSGGVLDPTFGTGGLVTTALGSYARAFAVATYPNEGTANDGKIVAAGDAYSSTGKQTEYMAVVRYNLDGTLDRTFAGTGEVMTTPGRALAVQVQPDGKVLAAGNSGSHFVIVRYNPDGTLDSSFGSAGEVMANVGIRYKSNDIAEAVVLQADGKIVVAGLTNPTHTTFQDLFLARFFPNGAPDASFGRYAPGGTFTTRFAAPLDAHYLTSPITLAIDRSTDPLDPNSGKFVVGCALQTGESIVARYTSNGVPDQGGFGAATGNLGATTGYVIVSGLAHPVVAVQSDDRIVVAGSVNDPLTGTDFSLSRLNPDGTLDASFGSGGVVVTSSPPNGDYAGSVTMQADGKIVVAGQQNNTLTGVNSIMVARYNTNGSLDSTFGVNGIATGGARSIGGGTAAVALEPDGRIVVAGHTQDQGPEAFSLARFLATGPQIGSFTASPNPVTAGNSATLSAANITDGNLNSTIAQVAFYVDSNGDGKLEAGTDTLLGYATQTSPGVWTFTFTVNLTSGTYTLFAQALNSYGVFGDPFASTLTVN